MFRLFGLSRRSVRRALSLALTVGTALSLTGPAEAVVMLRNFSELVPVKVLTTVNTTQTPAGTPVGFEFIDDVCYRENCLLKGTKIFGHIESIRPSKRFGRPAQYVVHFDALETPVPLDHSVKTVEIANPDTDVKFQRRLRRTGASAVVRQVLLSGISIGVTGLIAGVTPISGGGALYGIDTATDIVTGSAVEVGQKDPTDERSRGKKIVAGTIKGIIPFYNLIALFFKAPNFEHLEGAKTYFPYDKHFWKSLYEEVYYEPIYEPSKHQQPLGTKTLTPRVLDPALVQ